MYRILPALFSLALLTGISGCDSSDEEESDDLDPNVSVPANPVLISEGSLHLFTVNIFIEYPDIRDDLMLLTLDNFTPSLNSTEPDDDENPTLNDLGWTQTVWNEPLVAWASIAAPQLTLPYSKDRQYRILKDNQLSAPKAVFNRATYEAIDDNVYERQLGATFVWDLGNYTKKTGENVSGKKISNYEVFPDTDFDLLEYASIWAEDVRFSTGAIIYGATRSIAVDTLTVEAVDDDSGGFTLNKTRFGTGAADIETALSAYTPGDTCLEYRFNVDYSSNRKIYLSFDTAGDIAYVFYNQACTNIADSFSVPYTLHSGLSYIEIDTASLSESERIILGLPAYFNPIIAGPYTDNGAAPGSTAENAYFYGKHYIKTTEANRIKLEPVFFLNPIARSDVENAFKAWRQERHEEEDDY